MPLDNSHLYRPGGLERSKLEEQFQLFPARVLTVDYERKSLTLQNLNDKTIYREVMAFPAHYSSLEANDVTMPEQGATGLCCHLYYQRGFSEVAVIAWIFTESSSAVDAIATRPLQGVEIQGWGDRQRGNYRKAYPGQRTTTYKDGYTERIGSAWDRAAGDLSRDRLDPERRTWTQVTGRRVQYTDAGVKFEGPVNRPDAENLVGRTLPDGSQEYVAYLQPGVKLSERYLSGRQDVIPFAEKTELVQEFSLDYPLPAEILQTDLFDEILGTHSDPWQRTSVEQTGVVSHDDQTFMVEQSWDNPNNSLANAVGPTLNEGVTPRRRAFVVEHSEGTLVGHHRFDKSTYGFVLKPTLFPYTKQGRFGADIESGFLPVKDSADHAEARMAADAYSLRFPYEYNTTRVDVTKEGFTSVEIGSTIPKENIKFAGAYEHPHGAGRSLELHAVGSIKAVIGKNRDEEDALDIQALGQSVIRLGADDTSLPNSRRTVLTQIRSQGDAVAARQLQYWTSPKLKPGDAGDLVNKTGAENVSLRSALDGAAILRIGARNPSSLRRHLVNGYVDGQGIQPYAVTDAARLDSHSAGRPVYGAGDDVYAFHDLTQAGAPQINRLPYNWSGSPVSNMDAHGLSLDVHAVRDTLLRIGANPASGQSLLIDLAGGVVLAFGKDKQGRSITGTFDGGVEVVIRPNQQGKALRLEIDGDIDITHKGNLHWHTTGSWVTECTDWRHVTKTDRIFTQQKSINASLVRDTTEAPDIVHNQGQYQSEEATE